jgi:hypothetical protein
MAVSLKVINNFVLESNGITQFGKQGPADDDITDAYSIPSATGESGGGVGILPAETVRNVWASSADFPTGWKLFYLWSDHELYVQMIVGSSSVTFKTRAYVPMTLGDILAVIAASTDPIVGETEPTAVSISSINIGNYHATEAANYVFKLLK